MDNSAIVWETWIVITLNIIWIRSVPETVKITDGNLFFFCHIPFSLEYNVSYQQSMWESDRCGQWLLNFMLSKNPCIYLPWNPSTLQRILTFCGMHIMLSFIAVQNEQWVWTRINMQHPLVAAYCRGKLATEDMWSSEPCLSLLLFILGNSKMENIAVGQ